MLISIPIIYLLSFAASAAFFIVCLIFFRRASKACAAGGDGDGELARNKRIWLALLIFSSVIFGAGVLFSLWLAMIYIAAIFFM